MRTPFLIFLCGFLAAPSAISGFTPDCSPDTWFRCKDGLCLNLDWRCDGEPDCVDGSDEDDCLEKPLFSLANATSALLGPRSRDLDGTHPIHKPCDPETEFRCNITGLCIPKYWLCDKVNDCTDNSDEEPEMCQKYRSTVHCEKGMFFCNDTDKNCIPEHWTCDSKVDCPNGFDEDPSVCNTTFVAFNCTDGFECKSKDGENSLCLSLDLVCDNKADCPLGDDEGEKCAESCNNVACKGEHQECRGRPEDQGLCFCTNGYRQLNDSSCVDVNECELAVPPCSQICENSDGRFFCECDEGYRLDKKGNCKAAMPATLYFSSDNEIRKREISGNGHYELITNDRHEVRQAIGVAFDTVGQRIYWADVKRELIVSSNLDGQDFRSWNHSNIQQPEFLAIDYIGRNFYYSDSAKKLIGACTLTGHYCQGIITTGVTNPRGIAVQPDRGLLAYSNWDNQIENHPHIGLAGMDGDDLRILVNTSIRWPNGLAFDMPSNRLFWGEAYYDLLESVRLDGTGRISVKPATNYMSLHPFSVAVFEDTIYWSDYGLRDIQSCHKFTGANHKVIVKSARLQANCIQIVHELLEPNKFSPCNYLKCDHMCLIKKGGDDASCKCAEEFNLVNGHRCVPITPIINMPILAAPENTTIAVTTARSTTTSMRSTTTSLAVNSNEIVTSTERSTNESLEVVILPQTSESSKDNTTEVVIGTVVAILCFIALCLTVYCCWGKRKFNKNPLPAGVRKSHVFFKNPSFGLDNNNLKSNGYTKADEELQTVEVLGGPSTSSLKSGGREAFNYYSVDDDCQFEELNPQSTSKSSTSLASTTQCDLMVDVLHGDDDDNCQLLHED